MGWMQILYETYEKSRTYVGREDLKGCILLPIAHSTQNAQIEIAINLKGEFQSARKVEKAEAVTIIPVTEDSGSRSSGIAPHPLCDKLCYIAGDYEAYCSKKKIAEYYKAYMDQLEAWVQAGCHRYVTAVHDYVGKRTMIRDLVDAGVLTADGEGRLDQSVKIEGIAQAEAFIRFRIQDEAVPGSGEIWKEQEVYDDYIRYYLKKFNKEDLDYITGEQMPCSEKQPSKIRNSGDKSKLISANDSAGFTYRGRFTSKDEAVSVGYIPSQKAHNALRWLIERQAYRRYGMCVLTWNPENKEVPDWLQSDTLDLMYSGEENMPELGENYARQVNRAIRGRYADFEDPAEEIVVMALAAATPGRLSISYYQHMQGSAFLDHLIDWHTSCCWPMGYRPDLGRTLTMAPEPEDIVRAAYGVERNGLLQVDDRLMQDVMERLLPCIIEGKRIPDEIVRSAFENANRPLAFGNYNRRKIAEITCALIRKKDRDSNKKGRGEFDSMSLDKNNRHRDYLYGRLLAVAYKVEYDTFAQEERGKRVTNADRYRSMMVRKPQKTWQIVEDRIQPYMKKLSPGLQKKYKEEFQDIYDLFEGDDFSKPGRLRERFQIGNACELSSLWKTDQTDDK